MKPAIFYILLVLHSAPALAFVENITHGYPNCMSCHVSPSGGGVLNDYGRSLSKELMSTWGWKNSEQPLFGAVKQGGKFKIGGDIRVIQTHFENEQIRRGEFFKMQQNLELAYQWGKSWIVGAFGTREGPDSIPDKGAFLSERHYLLSELSESVFVRIGKFRIPFGIYDPNHTRVTEQDLGFGSNSESYNLEVIRFSEAGELFLGSSLGRMDIPRENSSEKNFYATYAYYLRDKNKIGASFLLGESDLKRRNLLSLFGVFALTEKINLVSEIASEFSHSTDAPRERADGLFTTNRVLLEAFKGFKPYVILEAKQSDLSDRQTRSTLPGFGMQWLPIPHIELQAEYQRMISESAPENQADVAWFLAHFYF